MLLVASTGSFPWEDGGLCDSGQVEGRHKLQKVQNGPC